MQRLVFIYNPYKPQAEACAFAWAQATRDYGAPPPRIASVADEEAIRALLPEIDLMVTLGGDGTLIHMASLGAFRRVPALGVKFGHVGFLSAIKPEEFPQHLPDILAGRYWLEERAMLVGQHYRAEVLLSEAEALNDVVVSRGQTPRVIRLATLVDGALLDEFTCDGAIVSTATGSTAYSLASGGPILAPTEMSYLLTLISPYLSPIRCLVLPHNSKVTFRVHSPTPASLTLDGREDEDLLDGDEIHVQASAHVARFARLQSRTYFYEEIKDRLKRTDP